MRKIRITYALHFHIRFLINGFWCRQKSFYIDVLIQTFHLMYSILLRCSIPTKLNCMCHCTTYLHLWKYLIGLRKCHNRYSFMISSIVMFYVFSYFSQHDDLLTTSSVTLQHMMWFSFTTTTSFYCYKIIRMESGNRTTTKQIFSWSINEDVLLVQTLWNPNRN